ncbi:hypothetical protein DSO57_1003450 [Entomophthora muscae]|uniref:Uncharacterized protein n=1 Tax=Entomophthora muscae TaxID=34485 RepID=A0ACC2UUZ0_9FUNG|nr:hypothetical protein DSO57_1003450 [Entomophthora muscae]
MGKWLYNPKSNKNTKQPKRQASKGSKVPATTTNCTKKPPKAKTPTLSPPTPSTPTSSPPTSLPLHPHLLHPLHHSSPNKFNNDLTDLSFYLSEADSVLTKEHRTKKGKAANEPNFSSEKEKEAFKQSLRNPSFPSPGGSSSLPFSGYQEEPEDYTKNFKATGHVAWDSLAIHNIYNVDVEFKVPKCFPWCPSVMPFPKGQASMLLILK